MTAEQKGFKKVTPTTKFPAIGRWQKVVVACLAVDGLPTVMIPITKGSRWDGKRYNSFEDCIKKYPFTIEYYKK